jgi:hypothetical protein
VLEYSANTITEKLYLQVNEEGHHKVMIEEIKKDKRCQKRKTERS